MASEKGVRTFWFFAVIVSAFFCKNVLAAFTIEQGYTVKNLYDTSGTNTAIGGLALDDGKLYFGNWTEIKSLDLAAGSIVSQGTIGNSSDIAFVARNGGVTYTAFSTTSNSPYPYNFGYIDSSGLFVQKFIQHGIYDAAVNSQGELYITANPDVLGSKIFKYDLVNDCLLEIADIGGYSGGIAFDSFDNLYYADQGIYNQRSSSILKFTAEQISEGGLFVSDAQSVLNITARFLIFDEMDNLFATTGYGTSLAKYDVNLGVKIDDIASTSRLEFIGKLVFQDDCLYTFTTDYANYFSTVRQITIPEPATILLLGLAGIGLRRSRV